MAIPLLFLATIGIPTESRSAEPARGLHLAPLEAVTEDGSRLELYRQSHALLIGNSRYETWDSLSSVPGELDRLEEALAEQGFDVERLTDANAHELRAGVRRFIDDHGFDVDNRLIIYFSGHGHTLDDRGFLLPIDAPWPDSDDFRRRALPMVQVMAWAREIVAKHVLFAFDSCFAGTIFETRSAPDPSERYIRNVTAEPVRQFITAGSADEEVPARSVFTPALIDAIRGEGDLNDDGYVTGSELGVHLSSHVPRYTEQTPQHGKIRDYDLAKGDFVFMPSIDRRPDEPADVVPAAITSSAMARTTSDEAIFETMLWTSAETDDTPDAYRAYLEKYPEGVFAAMARTRLARTESAEPEASIRPRAALEASPDEPFDLVSKATNIEAVRALMCREIAEPESGRAGELKREADALYSGKYQHTGNGDRHRGWNLYLDALEHCSTSALIDIADKLLRKKACDVALGYARLAADLEHASAPRLVSIIERKPARACHG